MSDELFGLKFKCQHCGTEFKFDFGPCAVRLTGALEALCPNCKKVSIFIGKFGQDTNLTRAIQDMKEAKECQDKKS